MKYYGKMSTTQAIGSNPSLFHQHLLNSLSVSSSTPSPEIRIDVGDPEQPMRSPPNISIGHFFVYNFPPPSQRENPSRIFTPTSQTGIEIHPKDPNLRPDSKVISPGTSSGPFCRICREGDAKEDLLSPCYCAGTVGLVHISCVERWLSLSGSDQCEICHYVFSTIRSPRSFSEWLQSQSANSGQRNLSADAVGFFLLTPLAAASSFLSVEGARKQVEWGNSIEAGCLMALATFLLTIYIIWNILTIRYHIRRFKKWRSKNQNVKLLGVRRLPSSNSRNSVSIVPRPGENQRTNTPETRVAVDHQTGDSPCTHVTIPVGTSDDVFSPVPH